MKHTRIYVIMFLVMIVLFYAVPYTALRYVKGLTLITYWSLLTLAWIITTILYIRRW